MNYRETQEWWLGSADKIPDNLVERHIEIMSRREARRIETARGNRKSDSRDKTSIAKRLGRGRVSGTVTECGRFLEIWLPPETFHVGNGADGAKMAKEKRKGKTEAEEAAHAENIAKRVNHRARKQIRRIVNANDFRVMYTLTIAPPSAENDKRYATVSYEQQKDYENVRRLFHNFLMRLRKAGIALSYLAVFELHDSDKTAPEKRGCWHVHIATNLSDAHLGTLQRIWQHGICDVQDYKYNKKGKLRSEEVTNPGAYMAEYIGKDGAQFGREELRLKRRYTTSRDVKRPIRRAIEDCGIGGEFDTIQYQGETYDCVYYNAVEVPLTDKLGITATYMLRRGGNR